MERNISALPNIERDMMCQKCRAGHMQEYTRKISGKGHDATLTGRKCSLCGFTELDSDDDIWSSVGL